MAGRVSWKFDWDFAGFNAARNSDPVSDWVLGAAQDAARRAGDGYSADVRPGKTRAQARVSAATTAADTDNRRNNTILKAGNGGAG